MRALAIAADRHALLTQIRRFLIVGTLTVGLDYVLYALLLLIDVPVPVAKGTSFLIATVCAYLLNRSWTFQATGGAIVAVRFTALYGAALGLNVAVNSLALWLLPETTWRVQIAFLIAQLCSSTFNFVGMRSVVFSRRM